jgi:hypothetical protein
MSINASAAAVAGRQTFQGALVGDHGPRLTVVAFCPVEATKTGRLQIVRINPLTNSYKRAPASR